MGEENIYGGSSYGFDSAINAAYGISEKYGSSFLNTDKRYAFSQFGFANDPFTVNQLQKVSEKISTGTKTIEVQGLNLATRESMKQLDMTPREHFTEINRLKKLTGVDLTFHGPLIEPTGFTKQGWNETDRMDSERNMKTAVQRAHELDPNGNIIVTFHSSISLPEPISRFIDNKNKEQIKEYVVMNTENGNITNLPLNVNYLQGETQINPEELLKKLNKDTWSNQLHKIDFSIHNGAEIIKRTLQSLETGQDEKSKKKAEETKKALLETYKEYAKGNQQVLKDMNKEQREFLQEHLNGLTHGELYLREVYGSFQDIFNRVYKEAEARADDNTKKKLDDFRNEVIPKINEFQEDPSKVHLLAEELEKGVHVLKSIEKTPEAMISLRPWALNNASETFANTAFDSYKQYSYNKSNETSPIICIENAPATTGLSKAEDLKDLIIETKRKFINKARHELGLSESEAKKQADKLIGATWDVGHINMLRGMGYSEKKVIEQTGEIAPYVKHVHLSDNFGLEHTELPMGMGNVPTKQMLDLIHQYNDKVKMIVETGDWYSQQGGFKMTKTPVSETMGAFGSPVYAQNMGPYWNQAVGIPGNYWGGQGSINPQIHHSIYGAGFSNLPLELGGQMAGQSRASGAPIE